VTDSPPPTETWTRYLPPPLRERLAGRPNLWRIIANVGWLFADRIVRLVVGLVIGVWVARYLGPEQFGLLNYAVAYVGLFLPFAMLGLDLIVVRDLAQDHAGARQILGTAFWLKLIAGTLAYAAAVVLIVALKPDEHALHAFVVLVGAILVCQSFDVVDFWFQAHVRAKYTVIARNTSFLIVSAVRLTLILIAAPVLAFAAAAGLEAFLSAVALIIAYKLTGEHLRNWRTTAGRICALVRVSWPMLFTSVAVTIYMRVDLVMLGEMRGDAEVGIYAAALRVSELWYIIPGAIVSSVAPAIAQAKKSNEVVYLDRLQKLHNVMAIAGYAVAIPITFLAGPIVAVLFGSEFARAAPTLAIHIWAGVFVNLGGAYGLWMINEGQTVYLSVSTAIGAMINVVINLLLIPDYGAVGAAIATLISYGSTVAILSVVYKPTRPVGRMILKALVLKR
jgi:O-antigen/teichoic acid export membrane protein